MEKIKRIVFQSECPANPLLNSDFVAKLHACKTVPLVQVSTPLYLSDVVDALLFPLFIQSVVRDTWRNRRAMLPCGK